MRKFGALLAVNLKAMLTSFRFGGGRKGRQKAAGYGALFLLAFLALYISGTYSFLIAAQLAPLGMERLVEFARISDEIQAALSELPDPLLRNS